MKKLKRYLRWVLGSSLAKPALAALPLLFLLTHPTLGHASSGDIPHLNWWTWDAHAPPVGWLIVDFVVFVAVLGRILRQPVALALRARHERIKSAIATSDTRIAEARATIAEVENKVARAQEESEQLMGEAVREADVLKTQILRSATTMAERLKEDAARSAEQQGLGLLNQMRLQLVHTVVDDAERLLRHQITHDDQARLFDEALGRLQNGAVRIPHASGAASSTTSSINRSAAASALP